MISHGARTTKVGTTMAIVEAVAEENGIDILDIETPLANVIDPDHLDALWKPTSELEQTTHGVVSFDYCGCRVTVKSNGTVDAVRL